MHEYSTSFSSNYKATLLFYHNVIWMPELEQCKEKLPYFPQPLINYFWENKFLKDFDFLDGQFNIKDYLNPLNSICGITLPEDYANHMTRIVNLMDLHENENPYEPFKNYEGGKKVSEDSSYPMPTEAIL